MLMIYDVVSDESITNLTSSVGITASTLTSQVTYAIVQAVTASIRFRITGGTPTSSVGHQMSPGEMIEVWGSKAMNQFRAIDDGGTANLHITLMGRGAP